MRGGGDQPARVAASERGNAASGVLRKMNAIGLHARGKRRVRADQQFQPAPPGDAAQGAGNGQSIFRAKMAKHNRRAARQARGEGNRVWRSLRVGEQEEGGRATAGRAFECARASA